MQQLLIFCVNNQRTGSDGRHQHHGTGHAGEAGRRAVAAANCGAAAGAIERGRAADQHRAQRELGDCRHVFSF